MEQQSEKDRTTPLLPKEDIITTFLEIFDSTNIAHKRSNVIFREKFENKNGLLNYLKVREEVGLDMKDNSDIKERTKIYGTNVPKEMVETSLWEFVAESLEDNMLRILLAASLVSLIIGIIEEGLATGWIEGTTIFLAVFIVVSITSFNNWSKDRQFNKLNKESKEKFVFVKREGTKVKINAEMLLVGDLLYINIGDIVTVDGILIEGAVSMDESAATGESDLIKKTTDLSGLEKKSPTPFVLSGTQTKEGEGLMVVCALGENTFSGQSKKKIEAKDADEETNKTPLEKQLEELAGKIGDLGLLMAIFIGIVMILKEMLLRWASGQEVFTSVLLDTCLNAFIISITVIVVAIPEGLPMAVTISLAFSVFKMKEEHNLVRHLEASETMGNVNNVCTDKTGTLTEGHMSINYIYTMEKNFMSTEHKLMPESCKSFLSEVMASNATAYTEKVDGKLIANGNMTEVALLQFLIDSNIKYDLKANQTAFLRLPFSSEYKFMISIWKQDDNSFRMYIKGAPERILEKCTHYYANEGEFKQIDSRFKDIIYKQQEDYAHQSMRTLVLAYRELNFKEINAIMDRHEEKDLEFFSEFLTNIRLVALLGIADAPRKDVPTSIKTCLKAGVIVRMVTGDNIKTAVAIARKVFILTESEANAADNYISQKEKGDSIKQDKIFGINTEVVKHPIALDGIDFRNMSGGYTELKEFNEKGEVTSVNYKLNDEQKFRDTTKNLKVIARASPDDKFLLVMGLKKIDDNIVAVTGDGTNDAPALKQSHVGFAMGKRGTDIAKDASDIILLNDSFSSVVTAIKYGRNVYDCIRKFIQFQLTTNIVAVFMTLLGGVVLKDSPLNAIQMLWVNLIMDSFASLALATEPPNDRLLLRQPYKKGGNIVTTMMLINIVTQAIYQIVILTIIIFYGDVIFGVPSDRELTHFTWNNVNGYHFTIFFNIFVFMQVFNSLNARKLLKSEKNVLDGIFNNSMYITVQIIIIVGQVLMVTFGGRALRTHPLSVSQHISCIIVAAFTLPVSFVVKLLPFDVEEQEIKLHPTKSGTGAYSRFSVGMAARIKSRTRTRSALPPTKSN